MPKATMFNETSASNHLAPAEPQISTDDFKILKVIGRGSFGKVYLVQKRDTGQHFAMKTLKKEHILRNQQKEKNLLQENSYTNTYKMTWTSLI